MTEKVDNLQDDIRTDVLIFAFIRQLTTKNCIYNVDSVSRHMQTYTLTQLLSFKSRLACTVDLEASTTLYDKWTKFGHRNQLSMQS